MLTVALNAKNMFQKNWYQWPCDHLFPSHPFSTLLVTKFDVLPDHMIKRCGSSLLPIKVKVLVKRNQCLELADIYNISSIYIRQFPFIWV